jgi:DNA-binding IclR family transcriptional regulator
MYAQEIPGSASMERMLKVLEFLSKTPFGEIKLKDVTAHSGLSNGSAYRIMQTLKEADYVSQEADRTYFTQFSLKKNDYSNKIDDAMLETSLDRLLKNCRQTVEFLKIQGDELYWHKKMEHDSLSVRVVANEGFKRSLYELDAPSCAFLHSIGKHDLRFRFEVNRFYKTMPIKKYLKSKEVHKIIFGTKKPSKVFYDMESNANGIRRYATLIHSKNGDALGVLSIAEALLTQNQSQSHIQKMIQLLKEEAIKLNGAVL